MCVPGSTVAVAKLPETVANVTLPPIIKSAEAAGVPSKPSGVALVPAKRVQENPNDHGTNPVDHKHPSNDFW